MGTWSRLRDNACAHRARYSIDLDIEGGSTVYFDSFINRIRALASGASKQYYVTAAPQCPYPDAYLGT